MLSHRTIVIATGIVGIGIIAAVAVFALSPFSNDDEKGMSASDIVAACADDQRGSLSKESCYSKQFQELAARVGPEQAFDTLFTLQTIDPDATGCHFIGHGIGYGTYERSPDTWQEDFRAINQACTYGAMHGILEMAVQDLPNGLTYDVLPDVCGTNPRGDCNHIVGHLTLLETRGDISDALHLCTALGEQRQQRFCETGVFMENITAVNLVEHGYADDSYLNWPARVPDIKALCQEQTDSAHEACWKEAAHAIIAKHHTEAETVFSQCNQARTSTAQHECKVHSIGIMAARFNFDLDAAASICTVPGLDTEFARECYLQLVSSTLSTSNEKAAHTFEFCAARDGDLRTDCTRLASNILRNYSGMPPQQLERICADVPADLQNACRTGGPVNFAPHEIHEDD